MAYFHYNVPNSASFFIGDTKREILETLNYYRNERGQKDFDIPNENVISSVERFVVNCAFPLLHKDHFIEAEVCKGAIFDINANALDYVKGVGQNYEPFKRGSLFKFQTLDLFGLFFLPESVMKGLRDYDWKPHEEQVREWMLEREGVLNEAESRGHLARVRKVPLMSNN